MPEQVLCRVTAPGGTSKFMGCCPNPRYSECDRFDRVFMRMIRLNWVKWLHVCEHTHIHEHAHTWHILTDLYIYRDENKS